MTLETVAPYVVYHICSFWLRVPNVILQEVTRILFYHLDFQCVNTKLNENEMVLKTKVSVKV